MTDFMNVVEANPVVFVNKIIAEIRNGYYVTNTMEGYPVLGLPNYIKLFEADEPTLVNVLSDEIHTVTVTGYDIMRWLLDVQDVVLQGFIPDTKSMLVDNLKTIKLQRAPTVSLAGLEPVESATEAPKPKVKRTPKPKSE